jgi:mono/diheme cytochrome c family protein
MPQEKSQAGAGNGAPKTNDLSGTEMYGVYCASCHGIDGKGSGPAAPALRKAPPDLTRIAKRNNGQFPTFRITHIIDGYDTQAAHGSRDMPIWGDYFRETKERDEAILKLREHNLTEYIQSIQQK